MPPEGGRGTVGLARETGTQTGIRKDIYITGSNIPIAFFAVSTSTLFPEPLPGIFTFQVSSRNFVLGKRGYIDLCLERTSAV